MDYDDNDTPEIRHYAVAFGDFDGDRIVLGEPNVFDKTEILQPLVILNAPPTHYDIINDTTYDINLQFTPGKDAGEFFSSYRQSEETSLTFETQVKSDWAVSTSAGVGLSAYGVDLGAKIERSYGESFSKTTQTSHKIRITSKTETGTDDAIYAYVVDYKIYEYPVVQTSNDSILGYVLAIVPSARQLAAMASKSAWKANIPVKRSTSKLRHRCPKSTSTC